MKPFLRLVLSLVLAGVCSLPYATAAEAECRLEVSPNGASALIRHLGKACTEEERLAHAVPSEEVLDAIHQGRDIDLVGVVVVGNVFLDELPLVKSLPEHVPPVIRDVLTSRRIAELRVVPSAVSIRDSRVKGTLQMRVKDGYVLMQGPVTMTGTTFADTVDLSRALFSGPADFSKANFLREALFTQTVFNKPARFQGAAFGAHARFHRAHFGDTATFEGAAFNGLAEFLEVTFDKEANFSRSTYKMGTGFSGARFSGGVGFSEAVFEREAFFLFTGFAGEADFRRSAFRGLADFSDAEFHQAGHFSTATFAQEPLFQRAKPPDLLPTREGGRDSRFFYALAASFLVLTVLLLWVFRVR